VSAPAAVPVQRLARSLLDAEVGAVPMQPLTDEVPGMTVDDAYAVQRAGRELRLAAGGRVAGHKIGLTSEAIQRQLGVDQPDYGYLLASMILPGGAVIDVSALIAPRVEGEVAFILGEAIAGAEVSADDVLAATASVAPALEIIDSRIADWRITLPDTIADNASCALAVVGEPRPPDAIDLPGLAMTLGVGEETVEGRGSAVLGHPATSVAWLVRALARHGDGLTAGEVVLSGALARAVDVRAGVQAVAAFDGLPSVSARFA
jgi:2-keto-4-pentenoate hydratase